MGIQTQFDKFHSKIKLGREDKAYKMVRARDDSITTAVSDAFKEAGYPVTGDFIQGSLATATAIVPLSGDYDIDRGLIIDADTAPDNPVEPKLKVLDILENRGFKNAKIKKPCVTADYASENVHIDFPIYKKSENQHYLAVGKKNSDEYNRSWSNSDPRGLIDWVNDRSMYWDLESDKHNQFQRLVRYLKRWRDHKFSQAVAKKVYSIGLTVMAKEQFRPSFNSEGTRQDILSIRDTVDAILSGSYFTYEGNNQYRVSVKLPKEPLRDIFDESSLDTGTQLRNKMTTLKDKLSEAADLDDVVMQARILQSLFGDDFEVPEPPNGNSGITKKARYSTAGVVGTSQGA